MAARLENVQFRVRCSSRAAGSRVCVAGRSLPSIGVCVAPLWPYSSEHAENVMGSATGSVRVQWVPELGYSPCERRVFVNHTAETVTPDDVHVTGFGAGQGP